MVAQPNVKVASHCAPVAVMVTLYLLNRPPKKQAIGPDEAGME